MRRQSCFKVTIAPDVGGKPREVRSGDQISDHRLNGILDPFKRGLTKIMAQMEMVFFVQFSIPLSHLKHGTMPFRVTALPPGC